MSVETGVGCVLCIAHTNAAGKVHGHSYEVVAWVPEGEDALELQRELDRALTALDHSQLEAALASGEDMSRWVRSAIPRVVEVEIRRPLERIYARNRG